MSGKLKMMVLPGIYSSVGVYPVTLKIKRVFNHIICLFNDIV